MTTPMSQNWFAHTRDTSWTCTGPSSEAYAYHRSLAGYAPTPLVSLPGIAREMGVGTVVAKDESARLGLPAFKALGASWAIHRALQDRPDLDTATIVTATDGNHGRAVAKFARMMGHRVRIVVPSGVHPVAVQAIRDEGAEVTEIAGSYDDAVAQAARLAEESPNGVLVQDMAWDGYEEIPGWIVEGYATLFAEITDQLAADGVGAPDLVIVPTGVGSLLQAALSYYRAGDQPTGTAVVSVEPESAACVLASLRAGVPVTVETGLTIMAGLNCGTPSSAAWPYMINGLDGAVSVSDGDVETSARDLGEEGIPAGPCGASGLAGLRRVLTGNSAAARRTHLGVGPDSVVVMLVTEGAAANPALLGSPAA